MSAPLGDPGAIADRLSQIVAGNNNLVQQPGVIQGLLQSGANAQQAQAVDQFVGGLNAEVAVRTAAAAGVRIPLTSEQTTALTAMGIDYSSVQLKQQKAIDALTQSMAAAGKRPVLDANGLPELDSNGNPLSEPLPKPKPKPAPKQSGGGGFWSDIAAPFKAIGNLAVHGQLTANYNSNSAMSATSPDAGVVGAAHLLNQGYQIVSTAASQSAQVADHGEGAAAASSAQDAQLAQQLGYDPSSPLSMLAFQARGYSHRDLTPLANEWDTKNPEGLFGWDGATAVNQAELFAANPEKFRQQVVAQGTDQDAAAHLQAVASPQFQQLVAQVQARKADIGTDVARGAGIDPVKHPTLFAYTSAGANIAASFALDPLAFGLKAVQAERVASTAVPNIADGEAVRSVLSETPRTMAQATQVRYVKDLVQSANDFRAADEAERAQIVARVDASNPWRSVTLDQFVNGGVTNYDEALDFIASKNALIHLHGGTAPVQSTVLPGALSSYGFLKLKGSLAAWSAGRGATKLQKAADEYLGWAAADPARFDQAVKDGYIARMDPQADDAVDPKTGEPLFQDREAYSQVTAAGLGALRRGELTYGSLKTPDQMSALSKVTGYGTAGVAARARLAIARIGNALPTQTHVSITDPAAIDTLDKVARTYLSYGDAALLRARWIAGDAQTRKTIIEGLKDQIAEAAGLNKTSSFRWMRSMNEERQTLVSGWKTEDQRYNTAGDDHEWKDPNGQPGAQWPRQVQTDFYLPNFAQVHHAAVKVGLYEATLGRVLTSHALDKLMTQWKLGALMRPITATRAVVESWLDSAAEGLFGKGLATKALLRDSGRLYEGNLARLPKVDKLLSFIPHIGVSRLYRNVLERQVDPEFIDAVNSMPEDLFHSAIYEQSAFHQAMDLDPGGSTTVTKGAELGLKPGRIAYDPKFAWDKKIRERQGFELTEDLDGIKGADSYAAALATRMNDESRPVASYVIAHLLDPEGQPIEQVIKALDESPAMAHTMYGKYFKLDDGTTVRATLDREIDHGKRQFASDLVADMEQLLTGRNGHLNKKLIGQFSKTGQAPSADWILDNVKNMERPQKVLAPTYIDMPAQAGVQGTLQHIFELESRGYQRLVEIPIQRHATAPLFTAAYADAKLGLKDLEDRLVNEGFEPEAADRLTSEIAAGQGWARVARMLDAPHMKMQMDIVGRGFFSFSRATTMMLRRWGSTFWRNPAAARRMQLAAEGAVQSGLVYKDENGQWVFNFPLSGVAMEVLQHAMSVIPGLHDMIQFPVADLRGQVSTIIPGSDNPFQYSTTPMVSLTGRWIASHFPEHREWFDEIDSRLNGSLGQGRGVIDTLTPSLVKSLMIDPQIWPFTSDDHRNTMVSSAMIGSLYNLYAAGMVPKEGASSDEWNQFFDRLRKGVLSQLFIRGAFGSIEPAILDTPEAMASNAQPDYAYRVTGARDLRSEFKELLNDTGGDFARANAIWARLHPDDLVYSQSGSQSTTAKALLAATDQAYKWLSVNQGFVSKYKSVAAYFVPQAASNAPFSMTAYRAELEQGLRQRKTPDEFLHQTYIAQDSSKYFAMEDKYKADYAVALGQSPQAAQAVRTQWLTDSAAFQSTHPLFKDWLQNHSLGGQTADQQLASLRDMVNNHDVPLDKSQSQTLANMIQAYDGYEHFINTHKGQDSQSRAERSSAQAMLQDYLSSAIKEAPDLVDVYNGVFRVLNTNLDTISQ